MNEHERYLLDLQGFLAVPNALSADIVQALNAALDEHIAAETGPEMQTHRFGRLLSWGREFRDLLDNPRITPYLEDMLGVKFRLDHDYADIIRPASDGQEPVLGPIGATLHGGGAPFDPVQYYTFRDGRMFNGLTVVAYNLKDVGAGDGGFACVPGSHKSHLPLPIAMRDLQDAHPCVQKVGGAAGTAIIFTEALTHGTLPWTGRGERRTLFFKFSPHPMSWAGNYPNADDYDDLTERQRAILEPPNARYQKY